MFYSFPYLYQFYALEERIESLKMNKKGNFRLFLIRRYDYLKYEL